MLYRIEHLFAYNVPRILVYSNNWGGGGCTGMYINGRLTYLTYSYTWYLERSGNTNYITRTGDSKYATTVHLFILYGVPVNIFKLLILAARELRSKNRPSLDPTYTRNVTSEGLPHM